MPELPEVEMARRYLVDTSLFQDIESTEVKDARILSGIDAASLEQNIAGRMFTAVCRHGKQLFLRVGDDWWLTLHLGLTGSLRQFHDPADGPRHCRLLISFRNGSALAYIDPRMFGEVGLTAHPALFLQNRDIGPDALEISCVDFLNIMQNRRGRIKTALLNQHLVAGLGNLYADEALFQAGIRPDARGLDERELKRLFHCIQAVLRMAVSCHARSEELPDTYLLPNRRPGGRCPQDGALLKHEKIGGRTGYYCPQHQAGPKSW